MAITALPPAPSRADPVNFSDKADAWVAALDTFTSEANTLASEVNTDANTATAASNAAIAVVNVSLWVSGTTYAIGAAVYSPSTLYTYRRKTAGAGTTDPSADPTNWQLVTGQGDVTLTAAQTLENKTIQDGIFTNGYTEETISASTGSAYTINLANGTVQILTLTANCTYTFPSPAAGKSFLLVQKQDATGSRSVTWPASVKWPAATAPTITSAANKSDVFAFTADGTSWYGRVVGVNYS